MGDGDPCEICGGTETNLVDGFYYCSECGTQDTNVRETLLEHNVLADGTFGIASKHKISRKLKEGVKMSAEWYKWHTLNFILAGLTKQLVQLGAAPSLKMKVLWIWTRYIKTFQKKDEMRQTQMFSKLEASSESENEKSDGSAAAGEREQERSAGAPPQHVTRFLLAALLALALNLDRGPLQLSHLVRLVRHRLLSLNDFQRFVPPEIDPADVPGYRRLFAMPLSKCGLIPLTMGRVARRLDLGPPRTPDLEAVLADQLRDLGLPPGLARLALALMDRAPVPFVNAHLRIFERPTERHPEHEAVAMAYVLVALKMCFGLDDDRERRLSAAVDRLDAASPDGPGRLFSPCAWLAHLQFRAAALGAHYAPLAWERNTRADDRAVVEHFEAYAYAGRARAGGRRDARAAAREVRDRVAMDVLRGMPGGGAPDVVPARLLRPCLAARTPHAALAAALATHAPDARTRRRLRDDFTRHSAEYAYRALALPGADAALFEGVAEAGKTVSEGPDRDYMAPRSDPALVHVRNCENKNWFKTRRPTASHVVGAEGPDAEPEVAAEPDAASDGDRREEDLETFREEAAGVNVFDDDFWDGRIKEEIKIECDPESFHEARDDPESRVDYFGNVDGFHDDVDREGSDADVRGGLAFDSDEERPRYDPASFDRHRTIREIMIEAYRELKIWTMPVRFAPDRDKPRPRARSKTEPPRAPPAARPADLAKLAASRAKLAAARGLVDAYRDNLRRDVLYQVARQVEAFVDDAERRMEAPDAASDRADASVVDAGAVDASSTDTRDVEVVGGDADDDDAAPGPAEDPLYEGDVRFDEKTHDARQLYVRLGDAPAVEPAPPDDGDDGDDEVSALLDHKIAHAPRRTPAPRTREKVDFAPFEHLVDDPENITKFNYWFTHYTYNFKKLNCDSNMVQQSFDETLPRSFRFVLRECSALLQLPPVVLYRHVMDVEDRLIAAMAQRVQQRPRKRRKTRDGARNDNKGNERAKERSDRSKENVSDEAARDGPTKKRKRKKSVTKSKLEDVDDDVSSAIVFF